MENKSKKDIFRVIKGGLPDDPEEAKAAKAEEKGGNGVQDTGMYEFASSWITDTRLMGVMAMYIHWRVCPEGVKKYDLHQYFYFDAIDTGFERFERVVGNKRSLMNDVEISFAGGLGGNKVKLKRQEAVYTFKHYLEMNRRYGLELPPEPEDYLFLENMDSCLSDDDKERLLRKTCTVPLTDKELINYFMMQICNLDDECIRLLSGGMLDKSCAPNKDISTLYKNDITEQKDETYYAESLVEKETGYEIWKSHITMIGAKRKTNFGVPGKTILITSFKRTSYLDISDTEAFLSLSHSEFVMVYKLDEDGETLSHDSTPLTKHSQVVDDEDGMSYMLFRPNNKHVDTYRYRLYDDIFGVYHLTSTGQLICSANTKHDMAMLELDLVFSPVYQTMELTGNYEFNEPVMAQFLSSGYDDFDEFMAEITQ